MLLKFKIILIPLLLIISCPVYAKLIKCPECGTSVSSYAQSCPKCACPDRILKGEETDNSENKEQIQSDPQTSQLKKFYNDIIIIESDLSMGSGFIIQSGETSYIITNQHVIIGAKNLKFYTLDNKRLSPLGVEISKDQDLVRIPFTYPENTKSENNLKLAEADNLNIGDEVVVYGNSQGQGAITELKGKILAIGPQKIETDAEFVSGNSGGPIINKDGEVVGVATYVLMGDKNDWVTKNTRFEKERRFGVRMNKNIQWIKVSPDVYFYKTNLLHDIHVYFTELTSLLPLWMPDLSLEKYREPAGTFLTLYDLKSRSKSYHDVSWCQIIATFCHRYKTEKNFSVNRRVFPKSSNTLDKDSSFLRAKLKSVIQKGQKILLDQNWDFPFLKEEADTLNEYGALLIKYLDYVEDTF